MSANGSWRSRTKSITNEVRNEDEVKTARLELPASRRRRTVSIEECKWYVVELASGTAESQVPAERTCAVENYTV